MAAAAAAAALIDAFKPSAGGSLSEALPTSDLAVSSLALTPPPSPPGLWRRAAASTGAETGPAGAHLL
eukprot:CAMPEP_0185759630 /NCGR_PEP_ID=MMETSP1174-20130828/18381_1 /TAXON_ID=35687 /ORGANISM="Dictyocha speculum, Strain CCMP1381" /LENGTH=67 /DNA_ID=CAMNT_0028440039 /DNA_START=450 /DNA_END=650 /DNA_ORIENTATION=-